MTLAADTGSNYIHPVWSGNGGTGFDAWVFRTAISGNTATYFVANTTANTDLNYIWTMPSFQSWGTAANGPGYSSVAAFRGFGANSLNRRGDTFRVSMENGGIQNGTTCGVVLRNGNVSTDSDSYDDNQRLQFYFLGGGANYLVIDSTGVVNTGVPFTFDGVDLVFTLTGANTYQLKIYYAASGVLQATVTGTLAGSGTIDSVALFNRDTENNDVFFNDLSICDVDSTPSMFLFK
jgi:hypothetical protein